MPARYLPAQYLLAEYLPAGYLPAGYLPVRYLPVRYWAAEALPVSTNELDTHRCAVAVPARTLEYAGNHAIGGDVQS